MSARVSPDQRLRCMSNELVCAWRPSQVLVVAVRHLVDAVGFGSIDIYLSIRQIHVHCARSRILGGGEWNVAKIVQ